MPAAAPAAPRDPLAAPLLLAWALVRTLGAAVSRQDVAQHSRSGLDEWLLGRILGQTFEALGADPGAAAHAVLTLKALVAHQEWYRDLVTGEEPLGAAVEGWLADADLRQLLQVNRHRDVLWFNREAAERLLALLLAIAAIGRESEPGMTAAEAVLHRAALARVDARLRDAAARSEFQVERLLALATAAPEPTESAAAQIQE